MAYRLSGILGGLRLLIFSWYVIIIFTLYEKRRSIAGLRSSLRISSIPIL
jgi:hypothetical protein